MSTAGRSWRRALGAAVTATVGVLLLGTTTIPASAAPAATEAAPAYVDGVPVAEYVQANDHELGSQIRIAEGDASSPQTQASALTPQGLNSDGAQALATVPGIDVSGHQGNVDWNAYWGQGKKFVYVKATEGTGYKNPYFTQQYNGSYNVGMIRGAYHFALPDRSSGAAQANYFVDGGGGWSRDGKTLPGALDMEYNPYGATCYGLSPTAMANWIKDFHDTYQARTGRWPTIYTSTSWWNQCVGGHNFGATVPLWIARYSGSVGALPNGWGFHTIWQYSSSPIDQNSFNGAFDRLQALANG
ncbi:lysozyme [Amycolatopsis antarctica]|uniref:Lysozyme n=1 Tax=Amycolatopsis antarctica TaxID=1854586 RepID=A0A263D298_9PSEU|nr:lysozyme [Amycolatopsis antarctica]OZM71475.1 lysozyme [Amycolatopsis antarctica]